MNIYDEAIHVQDACNPSGVARFLVQCITHIRDVEKVTDTDAIRRHPLYALVVNKLDSLVIVDGVVQMSGSAEAFSRAYSACRARSNDHPHREDDHNISTTFPGNHQPPKPATN